MAIKSFPYTSVNGDRKITASSEAERIDQIVDSGIIFDEATSFECSKIAGSMNINVAKGSAIVAGHTIISDAAEAVTIPASDSANPRIDIVVLESNINSDVRAGRIVVIKGTAAGTPVEPALSTDIGIVQIRLAKVLVPPSVASLSTATLTDLRTACLGKHEHSQAQIIDSVSNMYANGIINGDMQVWQRGTTIVPTSSNRFTADMWECARTSYVAGLTVSKVDYNQLVAKYALRAQRNVWDTSVNSIMIGYSFTSEESKKYIGKKITLSFSARIGANAAGVYIARIYSGTGTDQSIISGFTGATILGELTFVPTTTDQIFTVSTSLPISAGITQLGMTIRYTPTAATAGANDYIEITNCNWSATNFYVPFSPKSFNQELRDCTVGDLNPIGSSMIYFGSTVPAGWLMCQGQAVSRTTYAALYNAIGTTYGTGDGSTTFNLPNLKGKIPVGYDSAQTEFNTLGKTGGEKNHLLTVTEMPSHQHGQKVTIDTSTGAGNIRDTVVGGGAEWSNNDTNQIRFTGGDAAHNNLQPYITVNYIIKY